MSDTIGCVTVYVRMYVGMYVRMYVSARAAVQDRMDWSQFSKLMRVGAYGPMYWIYDYVCTLCMYACMFVCTYVCM
jgi:hypothetical protein